MNTQKLPTLSGQLSNDAIDNEIINNRTTLNSLIDDVKVIEQKVESLPSTPPAGPVTEIPIDSTLETALSTTTKNSVVVLTGPTKDFLLVRYQ